MQRERLQHSARKGAKKKKHFIQKVTILPTFCSLEKGFSEYSTYRRTRHVCLAAMKDARGSRLFTERGRRKRSPALSPYGKTGRKSANMYPEICFFKLPHAGYMLQFRYWYRATPAGEPEEASRSETERMQRCPQLFSLAYLFLVM
jgi:hypothetical protein